ncbi:MAG: hypothetical protein KC483_01225 [Nitrosarchaeum sp.]|nr:hypothetical protein [Nitrosarchaeum sp.]MCA9820923.1 hypothetical protein [Nitrosarchaeum sp.]
MTVLYESQLFSYVGIKTKIFVLVPLAVFAAIILGAGMYMTICKNSLVGLNC